jgi:ParB family chromosome partitioning protein
MEQNDQNPPEDNLTFPRRRLGRGLNSLLGANGAYDGPESVPLNDVVQNTDSPEIDVDLIERNPHQPRRDFDAAALQELVESVSQYGVLQPLLVRSVPTGGYQLIAGERRLIAAKRVGLKTVPCRVLQMEDQAVTEVAIIENLQRADLNDLEKAMAFQEYIAKYGCTIEDLARKMGKDRSTVSNCLRLLELPEFVKAALQAGKITAGHAKAMLPLETEAEQIAMCQRVQSEGMSVRQTEEAVRDATAEESATVPFRNEGSESRRPGRPGPSAYVTELQQQLRDLVGVKVEIKMKGKDAGRMVIHFNSNDEFERVVQQLRKAG